MKKVAILQSNYIPWKGYFDLIQRVDDFVFYDEVKYTWQDWRNRNKIKTSQGVKWLTIPIASKGKFYQRIDEAQVSSQNWHLKHWRSLEHAYARAEYFREYKAHFAELYQKINTPYLSQINVSLIRAICELLQIKTPLHCSHEFKPMLGKTERLLGICQELGADVYLSGPAANTYLDVALFQQAGIQVEWMEYGPYPEYPQLYPPFEHSVSVLDLIFNTGPQARHFLHRTI